MIGMLLLMLSVVAQAQSSDHVRSADPDVRAAIAAGLSRSQTFRELVSALDASDVIVYVGPRVARDALAGYLSHSIVVTAHFRYLRIAIDVRGGSGRVVAVLAHELQHAL